MFLFLAKNVKHWTFFKIIEYELAPLINDSRSFAWNRRKTAIGLHPLLIGRVCGSGPWLGLPVAERAR